MSIKYNDDSSEIVSLLKRMSEKEPCLWPNSNFKHSIHYPMDEENVQEEIIAASQRLERFAPYFEQIFPVTKKSKGLIESDLKTIKNQLFDEENACSCEIYIKLDSHLPISGSIKARGGIHEVLCHAEALAMSAGLLNSEASYVQFASEPFKALFKTHTIQVGSTGNLGLSIGIMAATLGFRVVVHMSSDAKAWKKEMLRSKGATVVEYQSDYGEAVAAGRALSDLDPLSYFVDDERSMALFAGYGVAGERLAQQLEAAGIDIDESQPLFVYLPCGVGGGPGGVAFGLKQIFGDRVHLFFSEPVASPCMLLSIATQSEDRYAVSDLGLDNRTQADGLAVGRASAMVSRLMSPLLDGLGTVSDESLIEGLNHLWRRTGLTLEPSALAGYVIWERLRQSALADQDQSEPWPWTFSKAQFNQGIHVIWATGGSMVPEADFKKWLKD